MRSATKTALAIRGAFRGVGTTNPKSFRGVIRGASTTKRKSFRGVHQKPRHHESSTPGFDSWCASPKGTQHHESNPSRRARLNATNPKQPAATKTQYVKNTRRCPRFQKPQSDRLVIRSHNQNTPKGQNSQRHPMASGTPPRVAGPSEKPLTEYRGGNGKRLGLFRSTACVFRFRASSSMLIAPPEVANAPASTPYDKET